MNVEWYSNKVKPAPPYCYQKKIVVAMNGRIQGTHCYNLKTNTLLLNEDGDVISLSDERVDGWCYADDLYPRELKM
jgi:hypothetical protein